MTINILGYKLTVQKEQKTEVLKVNVNEQARKQAVSEVDLSSVKAKLAAMRAEG
jgi:hypothetical protein